MRKIKEFMNKIFIYSGAKALYFCLKNRNKAVFKCPILVYHSIDNNAISLQLLNEHIEFLSSRFQLITLKSLYQGVITSKLPLNPLVITFDDGYKDNYELALPILEKYQVVATMFISTGYIGSEFQGKPTMTPEQIKALANYGIEIGAHSVTHPDLRRLNREDLREELASSKARLEGLTGVEVISFAYPTGFHNSKVVEMAKEVGFKIAVTTIHDFMVNPNELLECPRLLVYPYESCKNIQAKLNGDQHWLKLAHKLFLSVLNR